MNERINKILCNPVYQEHIEKIAQHEKERLFCRHDMPHFLDTARIVYILNLEAQLDFLKDVLYAMSLLHDIGRWQEYETGIKHALASATLCEVLLIDADFNAKEIEDIKMAILNHSTEFPKEVHELSKLLYFADKKSRSCYACPMDLACDWTKKNEAIIY